MFDDQTGYSKPMWKEMADNGWLGLSFLRVELSASMYEPEKGEFDWDNEEMRALLGAFQV